MADTDEKLEKLLEALLEEQKKQNERQEKADKKRENEEKEKKTGWKGVNGNIKNLKQLPVIGSAINKATQTMSQAFKQSFEIQKQGLARGVNLSQIMQRSADSNNQLAGKLTGAILPLEIELQKMEAGLGKTSAATDKLALMTKVTGGDSKKLLKQIGQLNMGVGMSMEQQEKFSNSIGSLSQTFGMTVEELMGTIKGLDRSMPMFKMLGIAPEISEATARLGAALGPEAGNMAAEVISAFTDANGAVLASQLGVMNERNALLKKEGDTTANTLRMVEQAGKEAERMYESYLAGTGDPAIAYKAVEDALGPAMAKSAMTYKQMAAQAKEQGKTVGELLKSAQETKEINNKFQNTLDNFLSKLFYPIEQAVTFLASVVTDLMEFANGIPGLVEVLGFVVSGIAGLVLVIGGLATAMMAFGKFTSALQNFGGFGGGGGGGGASGGGKKRKGKKGGGGIGDSLGSLGKGIGKFGKGVGKGIYKVLAGIANGIAKFGNPKVILGGLAMIVIAASLIPLAYGLKIMKGVGFKTIFVMGAALISLALAAAVMGAIMASGIGAAAIFLGALAFAALGASLIPLAYALNLASPALQSFAFVLSALGQLNPLKLMLLGPALGMLAIGFAALTASSILGGIANFFMGDKSPIDKLIELGKAAVHINQLASSIRELAFAMSPLGKSLKTVSDKDLNKLKKVGQYDPNLRGPSGRVKTGNAALDKRLAEVADGMQSEPRKFRLKSMGSGLTGDPVKNLGMKRSTVEQIAQDRGYEYKPSSNINSERIAARNAEANSMRDRGSSERGARMYEMMSTQLQQHSQLLERIAEQGETRIRQGAKVQSSMDAKDFPSGAVQAGNK